LEVIEEIARKLTLCRPVYLQFILAMPLQKRERILSGEIRVGGTVVNRVY